MNEFLLEIIKKHISIDVKSDSVLDDDFYVQQLSKSGDETFYFIIQEIFSSSTALHELQQISKNVQTIILLKTLQLKCDYILEKKEILSHAFKILGIKIIQTLDDADSSFEIPAQMIQVMLENGLPSKMLNVNYDCRLTTINFAGHH